MPKPLRLAIIRQRYTEFGGAEKFINTAIDALIAAGNDIEIFLFARSWKRSDKPENFHFIKVNPFYIGRLWRDWSFSRQVCKEIQKYELDVVQAHERVPCADVYRAGDGVHRIWLRRRSRTTGRARKLLTQFSPYHHYVLRQERRLFESTKLKGVITNSKNIACEIVENFSIENEKIQTIYNAVDVHRFNPENALQHREKTRQKLGIKPNEHLSLFVGSGYERKGVPLLLNIFKQLPSHLHLVIIGNDRNLKRLQDKIKNQDLQSRIHLLGPIADVIKFYGAADLFVFPSLYDPLPNSVIEAAACGLPVLASNTTGAAEVASRMGATTLSPYDPSSWKAQILTAAENKPVQRQSLVLQSPNEMSAELLQFYQNIIKKK
jgi:UDP-glucose:(heptosyl)LPS alpha-1,3-glucosyltransferase